MHKPVSISLSQAALAKEVSAYLSANIGKDMTVSHLAQHFHVSKSHLQHVFRSAYGTSVMAYMRTLNMHTAAELLSRTERSVLDIAGSCGYDNPGKFSAAFYKIMGQTPLEYRKSHHVLLEHFSGLLE